MRRQITVTGDVKVSKDDIFDALDNQDILDIVDERGLSIPISPLYSTIHKDRFRRVMCDMLDCGYCASDGELVEALLSKIKQK